MSQLSDQLGEYVGSGETLEAVYAATLAAESSQAPVSVALTDRRLFWIADEGRFGNVDYDAITTVRSQPRTTRTYCFDDYRLALGVGGLAAVVGFAVAVAVASTLLVPFLLLAGVCGLVTAEAMRRHADDIEWRGKTTVRERLDEFDLREAIRRFRGDSAGGTDLYQLLLLASGLLGIGSFVGVVLVTASVAVAFGTALLVGGLALVDYAYRHRVEFEGFDIDRTSETTMIVSTADDRTLRFRVDPAADICKDVSRLAFGEETATR